MISLRDGPRCVCGIAEDLGIDDYIVSRNLKNMEGEDPLVQHIRDRNTKTYSLTRGGRELYKYLSVFDSGFKDLVAEYNIKKRDQDE